MGHNFLVPASVTVECCAYVHECLHIFVCVSLCSCSIKCMHVSIYVCVSRNDHVCIWVYMHIVFAHSHLSNSCMYCCARKMLVVPQNTHMRQSDATHSRVFILFELPPALPSVPPSSRMILMVGEP